MPPYKTESTLRRGTACLSCRKRKLKCDGVRPVCRQCNKMNRSHTCEYDDKQQKSRTQLLKEQLAMLEKRLQELEGGSSNHSSDSLEADMESYNFGNFDGASMSLSPFNTYTPPLNDAGSSSSRSSPSVYTSELFQATPASGSSFDQFDSDSTFSHYTPSSQSNVTSHDQRSSLPPSSKKYLLDVFVAHKHQCWFYGNMNRFYNQPHFQSYSEEPHPALVNAIFLLACHYTGSTEYSEMESMFFTQTLQEINTALDTSDRLVDIVQASSLLAIYLYTNHRVLEGYRHSFSAIRLAVGLGLHQIRPLDISSTLGYSQQTSLIPLPAPQNHIELTDRIFAFWQIFMVDRCWSVAYRLPLALPDKDNSQTRIQTPWPIPPEEFDWEDHAIKGPLQLLFQGQSDVSLASSCIPALKAKAAALYEWTSRVKTDKSNWTEYCSAETALQSFSSTLPSLPGNRNSAWGTSSSTIDYDYFAIQTMIYTSFIHLQQNGHFDERAFKAASSIVRLIHQLNDGDYQYVDPLISACWHTASKLFVHALANIGKSENYKGDMTTVIQVSNQGLDVLSAAMKSLGVSSALSSDFALKLDLTRSFSPSPST